MNNNISNYFAYRLSLAECSFRNSTISVPDGYIALKRNANNSFSVFNPYSRNYKPEKFSLIERVIEYDTPVYLIKTERIHIFVEFSNKNCLDLILGVDPIHPQKFIHNFFVDTDCVPFAVIKEKLRYPVAAVVNDYDKTRINIKRHQSLANVIAAYGLVLFKSSLETNRSI